MQGFNACWVPGTDHASIATEAKVVGMLREKGHQKATSAVMPLWNMPGSGRKKYGGIILQQLKELGCSMRLGANQVHHGSEYYDDVIDVFIDLFTTKDISIGVAYDQLGSGG